MARPPSPQEEAPLTPSPAGASPAPPPPPLPRRERLARWAFLLPLLALVLGALFLAVHLPLKPVLGDEGVTAVDAWRMGEGQLPQRDYFEVVPPLSAGLLSWVYRAFGPSVSSVRGLGLVYGLLLMGLTWAAARRYCGAPACQALPLALLVPFGVGAWPLPSHHWLADLFCLAALLALDRATGPSRTFAWAAAGGASLAAACFTLQDQGGLALLVSLVPLAWGTPPWRRRYLAGLAAGTLGVAALVAWAWLPWDPALLWRDWFAFPAGHYRRIPENAVGFSEGLAQVLRQWDPVALRIAPFHAGAIALASTLLAGLPLAVVASAWPLWRDRDLPRPRVFLLLAFAGVALATAFHRWSQMNLIWAAPLASVALAAALDRAARSPSPAPRWWARLALGLLLVTFLAAGLLRVAFVLRTPGREIVGRAGTYRTFNPAEAQRLQEFVDAIEGRVPQGDGAFVRGFIPLVSFLTLRPNPTPFTYYLPGLGYQTPEQAERWCRSLEERGVRWGLSVDQPLHVADPADRYLSTRYRVVWRNGTYCLWERNP